MRWPNSMDSMTSCLVSNMMPVLDLLLRVLLSTWSLRSTTWTRTRSLTHTLTLFTLITSCKTNTLKWKSKLRETNMCRNLMRRWTNSHTVTTKCSLIDKVKGQCNQMHLNSMQSSQKLENKATWIRWWSCWTPGSTISSKRCLQTALELATSLMTTFITCMSYTQTTGCIQSSSPNVSKCFATSLLKIGCTSTSKLDSKYTLSRCKTSNSSRTSCMRNWS